jgi:hypothetical protein
MRLWLSGEGPTDLGTMRPGLAGDEFRPGPMAVIVDHLAEARVGYSLLETHQAGGDCIRYVRETELAQAGKKGPLLLPGVKFGKHNTYFTRNAQVLGQLAKSDALLSGRPTAAILFRDGDGTRSVPKSQWQEKFDSIKRGFEIVEYLCGVPMVPRPKSEAWLLCALRPPAYADCAQLEDASGNDASPNSLKHQLEKVAGEIGADGQAHWVRERAVDVQRIDMPSFNAFRSELERALVAALA